MQEKFRIFSKTRQEIELKIKLQKEEKEKATQYLVDLDSLRDGDMMDDPLMHRKLEDQQREEAALRTLISYLSPDVLILSLELLGDSETVKVGHEVDLEVKYEDGETDEFTVVLGSVIDFQFLNQKMNTSSGSKIVSEESPLATALLGKSEGDRIKYEVNGEQVKGKIVAIRPSKLVE
jgi:transcription elongation GreA/GreB family factor